jgi:hypothetical protein
LMYCARQICVNSVVSNSPTTMAQKAVSLLARVRPYVSTKIKVKPSRKVKTRT